MLSVSGSFASGVLTITLDADGDTATVTHDGTNLLLNGLTDIDPGKAGDQEVLLTDLKDIVIEGKSSKVNQSATLDSTFDSLVNLSVSDIDQLTISGTYDFSGNVTVSLSGTGGISDAGLGILSVGGTTLFDVGDADITLENLGNDFVGEVTLIADVDPANDVRLADANDLNLANVDIAGNLQISIGGALSNSDGTTILVQGSTTIIADDANDLNSNNDIILGNGVTDSVTLNSVTLQTKDDIHLELTSDVTFDGASEGASLTINTSGGITDQAAATLSISGLADFSAGTIVLGDDSTNVVDFGRLTVDSTGDVTIEEDSSMLLAGANSAQNLSLISSGKISNDLSASLNVSDTLTLEASSVQLGDQTGDLFSTTNLTVSSVGATLLQFEGDVNLVGGSAVNGLDISTTGSLSNSAGASLNVSDHARLSASNINLGNAVGDSVTSSSISFSSSGDVRVAVDGAIEVVGVNVADTLRLTSTSKLSNSANASISVAGLGYFGGSEINLGVELGDSFNAGTLTFQSTGEVVIFEDSDTALVGANAASSLTLNANGAIANAANATIAVSTSAFLDGSSIALGDQAGDWVALAGLRFVTSGSATFELDGDVTLFGACSADNVLLTSTGTLGNDPGATLSINGHTTLGGMTIDLGTQVGDSFTTQTLTLVGNGDVTLEQDSDIVFVGVSQLNSLDVTTAGSVINDAGAVVAVSNHAVFSGSAISIGTQIGDSFTAGSLSFTSAGAVDIAEDHATVLAQSSIADQLTLSSTGSLSNSAGAIISVSGIAELSGATIDLGGANGDSVDFGELHFNSSGGVSIMLDGALMLRGTNTSSDVTLSAIDALAMRNGAALIATGAASLSGASISVGVQSGSTFSASALTLNSMGNVFVRDSSDTLFAGSSVVQNLSLVSLGTVTNAVGASITVAGTFDVTATSVTLGNQAGDVVQFDSMRATTGDLTAALDDSVRWTGSSSINNLTLSAIGSIENDVGASLVVAGTTDISADSILIGDQTGDLFTTGTLTLDSSGSVMIHEDNDIDLVGSINAGTLELRASGSINDANGISIQVADSAFFGATGNIVLGNDLLDTLNFGSLGLQGAAANVSEDSSTHLDGVDVLTLSLASKDLISQSGNDTGAGTGAIEVAGAAMFNLSGASGDLLLSRASSSPSGTVNDGPLMDNRLDGPVTITGVSGDLRLRNTSSGAGIPIGFGTAFTNLELDFTATSISLGSLNVSNDLIISVGGNIEDAAGASIIVGGDASLSADGWIILSDHAGDLLLVTGRTELTGDASISVGSGSSVGLTEASFNSSGDVYLSELDGVVLSGTNTADNLSLISSGPVVNLANTTITVAGLAVIQGSSINLGQAIGDFIDIGELSLWSFSGVNISVDAATSLTDIWVSGDFHFQSTGDVTSSDNAFIYIGGHAEFDANALSIGRGYADFLWFSSLQFHSTNAVWIESESEIRLIGNSSADSLVLIAGGDIVGAAGGQLTARTAYFEADGGWASIDLGSTGFTSQLTLDSDDLDNAVGFYAENVYLRVLGDIVLDTSWVFDTLYIETQGILGGGGSGAQAGHVFQRDGSFIYAFYLGIDAMGSVQLSDFYAYEIAVSALQAADVIGGIVLNSVVEPAIAAAEFGVVLVSNYWTTVGSVFAPFGIGNRVEGLTADTGHLYVETRYNSYLDLFANVVINDPTKTITAIGDGGIYIFSGYFARGSEGRVSSTSIPLQLNGYGAGTNFVAVDVLTGLQELAFNYGNWGDGHYTAQVVWADGEVETYNVAQLSALNPTSSIFGAANPIGSSATILVKSTPYSAGLLLTASSLRSTLTIFGDAGIRLYANDGLTNLNQATLEFTALVARDKLAIPINKIEGYAPTFVVDENREDGELILTNQTQQQNSFDGESSQTEASVAEVYTVRVVDGVEFDRMTWSGEFGSGDVLEIKQAVISKHRFLPGTYVIRRVTADGETVVIDEFVKGGEPRQVMPEVRFLERGHTRWYAELPEFQSGEAVAGTDGESESTHGNLRAATSRSNDSRLPSGRDLLSETVMDSQPALPASPAPNGADDQGDSATESAGGNVESRPEHPLGNPESDRATAPGTPDVPGPEGVLALPVAHFSIAALKRLRRIIRDRRGANSRDVMGQFGQEDQLPSFDRRSRRARARRLLS